MPDKVPFINRHDELRLIKKLANEWGTRRVLCLNASGGIGKTRLLQEMSRQLALKDNQDFRFPLVSTPIIDFDDHALQIPSNLGRAIAEMMDKDSFGNYFRILSDLHKMEEAGISSEGMLGRYQEGENCFAECFNKVCKDKRIILYMDTTDALRGKDIPDYLVRILPKLENMFLLIAGRTSRKIGEEFQERIGEKIWIHDLLKLDDKASESYLLQKQKMLHISLEPNLAKNLIFYADGRPILLDLAVEWRIRKIPLEWLSKDKLEDLEKLSEAEKEERRLEFESQLVSHIADTRQPEDWLILLMSLIYPLNEFMIAELLKKNEEEAISLFEEMKKFVFIKLLPDGRICLHDEMRRMIDEYVWHKVDPELVWRRRFLNREIGLLTKRIDVLYKKEEIAREQRNIQVELSTSADRVQLEQRRWRYKKDLMDKTSFEDVIEIVGTVTELFDETTKIYRFSLRDELIEKMESCLDRLPPEKTSEAYELNKRRVGYLYDNGEYKPAGKLASTILAKGQLASEQEIDLLMLSGDIKIKLGDLKEGFSDLVKANSLVSSILNKQGVSPKDQVNMLLKSGNIEIRLGSLKQGIDHFENAVRISRKHDLKHLLVHSLNARGWAFHNIGNADSAITNYSEAYRISLQIRDYQQTILLTNNMSILYAWKGKHQIALKNCENALELCKKTGFRREVGMVYSTHGRVYELSDQTDKALNVYEKALDIFSSEKDIEWISRVRCNRASVFLSRGEPDRAEKDLDWALDKGPKNLLTRILFFQAKVCRIRNELKPARKKVMECQQYSREIGDDFFDYASFPCLIELAGQLSEFGRWQEFQDDYEKWYAERKSEINLRLRGTSLRRIGDLAICNGDYKEALNFYSEALPLIAEYEVLQRYTIAEQIRETEILIAGHLKKEILNRLGRDLAEFWNRTPELIENSPESLLTFQRWEW